MALVNGRALDKLRLGYVEQDEWPLETLEALVTKGLKSCLAKDGGLRQILDHEEVIDVEKRLWPTSDQSSRRNSVVIDLITERGQDLIVTDHKTSLKLDAKWVDKNLLESESSWQLWDYAWRVGQYLGKPVTHCRTHLLVLSPRAKSYLHEFRIDQATLERWHVGAMTEWSYIRALQEEAQAGETYPMRLTSCHNKYGKCIFYDACHLMNQHPEKMKLFYRGKIKT